MNDFSLLKKLCQLIRYDILTSTTTAGSGHPTSSLSAVELATDLFFGGFFRYDLSNPNNSTNDRFILSKGHASPLLFSLYHAAGAIDYKELMTLRKFDSVLEGHPTPRFKYVDVATGSLGQGLSVGVGMTLGINLKFKSSNLKLEQKPKVFVLLGDSEMAEGQVWEAVEIASYYKLDNLIGIIDVNRLGQRGETMLGWDLNTYQKRISSFGWETIVVEDGNDINQVYSAYQRVLYHEKNQPARLTPKMIIAKTVKGKGVSFLENKNGWHGKVVPKDKLQSALEELGDVDLNVRGTIIKPSFQMVRQTHHPEQSQGANSSDQIPNYKLNDLVATREAYGDALVALAEADPRIVVLDAEVSNSTYSDKFGKKFPERFFEMFIAEQNMVSTALGLSKIGCIPFVSSFAAFLTRAFDQIRMSQYSKANLKIVGSHAGVSIGQDGPSQMALEDLAMMNAINNNVIFYPCDAVSSFKLTQVMAKNNGIFYLRTTREKTPIIYKPVDEFKIGGSKILHQSPKDVAVVIGAGITVHEALKAYDELKKEQIYITIVDLYSIKPVDEKTLKSLAEKVKNFIVVEDHYHYGGIGDAVLSAISNLKFQISNFTNLSVNKTPKSGSPEELLHFEEIDAEAIVNKVKNLL